ncbi:DUF6483 family protein [Parvimonas micra]|jgi:hypothetical protein|uniref:Uncharacterized protein n=2 Tax=Parvimonas micra TaxID=33033 RepID=A0A0B4S334_9FIRM|nr:DUF6483 family protein [Parvimonas micra]AIZ37167.1 hypothetical protein NW74_07435 [Parvimonas micra]AXU11015.1 hypothetical protein DYJ31_06980 [Parvimonas micra]EDP24121.1 hypothetical protein PEPMIC_00701 [Parvimonas micra ATCC 33270]MBF1276167.1 hypothetical protein [Parvimonas micra]MBF1306882.1 hypothetical protein [Parvimonas micra]
MLKNDYIMRKIEEWISMILEFVFKIDKNSSPEKLLKLEESKEVLKDLKSKIDIGNINEAEDSLFEMLKHKTQDSLLIGLLFYSYLNEKDSKFLNEHDFERDEIKTGIKDLLNEFNMNNLSDLI